MRIVHILFCAYLMSLPARAAADGTELKVGFIAPFSGAAQAYGEACRNGFELGRSETGDRSVSVAYEDDQFTPAKTVLAFRKLTEAHGADVIVCVGSATCNAAAPLAEAQRIPLVGFASDPAVSKGRPFVIRSYPSGQEEGKRTGQEAITRGLSKIGVITAIHDYPLSWREGVLAVIPPEAVALDEQVPPDLRDFKPLLLKARRNGVKDFLLCTLPGQSGNLAKQWHESGMKPKVGGCFFLEDESEAKLAGGALDEAWYVTVGISPDFIATYEKRYGSRNTIAAAAVNYDLFKIFSLLVSQGHISDFPKRLMDLAPMKGAAGSLTMRNDGGDRFFNYGLIAKEVKAQ